MPTTLFACEYCGESVTRARSLNHPAGRPRFCSRECAGKARRKEQCGTTEGWQRHKDNDEPPCQPCAVAWAQYRKIEYPEAWVATCGGRKGTYAGWNWHRQHDIPMCPECRAAQTKYMRRYRRAHRPALHAHQLPEWLVQQLIEAAPPALKRTATEVVACCVCTGTECADSEGDG